MDIQEIKQKVWWSYLEEGQRCLIEESLLLLAREENGVDNFHDYAFIAFPIAKAYEGFLKKLFLDLGLINKFQYESDHFRIGKSLNPGLPKRFRNDSWVYDDLTKLCQSAQLPQFLWNVWKESRNIIFHWFPKEKNFIDLAQARKRVELVIEAIEMSLLECNILPREHSFS